MKTHSFTLLNSDIELHLDALYEAGCDDALFGSVDGAWHADFDRESDGEREAVIESAVRDIESTGVRVVGILAD